MVPSTPASCVRTARRSGARQPHNSWIHRRHHRGALALTLALAGFGCGQDAERADNTTGSAASAMGGHAAGGHGAAGSGGQSAGGYGGYGGGAQGGAGQGGQVADLDELLDALRADLDGAMLAQSRAGGWPAPVADGQLFVSTELALGLLAGDHDNWAGTPMQPDTGFHWLVLQLPAGSRYKFTDGQTFQADAWSRAYSYDEFGLMSQLPAPAAHLERHFRVAGSSLGERTVRVWLPSGPASHIVYAHDGQNLFNPQAAWGGWQLQQSVPGNMMIAAVDNTAARFDEYTHVSDIIGSNTTGGSGDAHADMLQQVVRPLIEQHYGEPAKRGLLGSSLGGLISLHTAHRHPNAFQFVASLSGTLGWGSIGLGNGSQNETIIERYAMQGHSALAIYLDSGGNGNCYDGDNDGIEDDDPNSSDNYCETKQLAGLLDSAGYSYGVDLWYSHEPGAPHNEAAWAARVSQPLQAFAAQ